MSSSIILSIASGGSLIVFTQGTFTIEATIGALAITMGPCVPTTGLTGCDGGGENCTGFTFNPSPVRDDQRSHNLSRGAGRELSSCEQGIPLGEA